VGHLRDDHKGGDVLVVGHSNTLPAILRELGIKKRFGIALDEYDNLFVVRIAKDGKATILHLHYGKRDAPKKKD
jgi:broad specificity phosphatase PhoE